MVDGKSADGEGEIEIKLTPVDEITGRDCKGTESCVAEKR